MRLSSRPTLVVALVACAAALAGCTTSEGPSSVVSTPATAAASPTPTSTSGLDPTDEAAIRAAWDAYWVARTAAYAGPDASPSLWTAFAGDAMISKETSTAQSYIDNGVVFTGAPRTSDVRVAGEGDSATVTGCVDETDWVGTMNGEALEARDQPVHPQVLGATRVEGVWRVDYTATLPEGVTC